MNSTRARSLLDRDRLNNAPRAAIATGCVKVFDGIQKDHKEHQLLAMACAFSLMCEACRIEPSEVYRAATNLMASKLTSNGRLPQFNAMKFHLETEVLA